MFRTRNHIQKRLANMADSDMTISCILIQDYHLGPKYPFRNRLVQTAPIDTCREVYQVYTNKPVVIAGR